MATNKVYCRYQEIIDLNTVGDSVSVIGIHTPTGDTPRKMFPGLFTQYKKWKYLGCSIVGANAAQLPVDPLGLGYEAGEGNDTIADPRDILNPILFHGCHGEDLGAVLNRLYGIDGEMTDSLTGFTEDASGNGRKELVEGLYYKSLTDATWKKFGIQSGIRLRGLHPLVYSMATNHYIAPNEMDAGMQFISGGEGSGYEDLVSVGGTPDIMTNANNIYPNSMARVFTPRLTSLGWMETKNPQIDDVIASAITDTDGDYTEWMDRVKAVQNFNSMPKIFMGVLLLPPSYRIKQFMRLVITHRFVFKGFRGASMLDNVLGSPSFFEIGSNVNIGVDGATQPSNDDTILGGNPGESSGSETEYAPISTISLKVVNGTSGNITVQYPISISFGGTTQSKGTPGGGGIQISASGEQAWNFTDGMPTNGMPVGSYVYGNIIYTKGTGTTVYTAQGYVVIESNDVSRTITITVGSSKSADEEPEEVKE